MATTIAARAVVSKLVEKIRIPSLASRLVPAAATTTTRSFNTNALCEFDDYDRASEVHSDSSRRSDSFLSSQGVFVPFNSTRSLSQVLNLMEQIQILDNVPFLPASAGPSEAVLGFRRGWEVREDDDALHLRVDMPGLGKEHVKVSIEQNTLVIQGEGEKEETGEERESAGRRYRSCIVLPPESFRTDQIRAEMKNGVLKVVVPKLKEELKDVFEVKIK